MTRPICKDDCNDLIYTVAKHSLSYSVNSSNNQEIIDVKISINEIVKIDRSVTLADAIKFNLTEDTIDMMDLNVSVV